MTGSDTPWGSKPLHLLVGAFKSLQIWYVRSCAPKEHSPCRYQRMCASSSVLYKRTPTLACTSVCASSCAPKEHPPLHIPYAYVYFHEHNFCIHVHTHTHTHHHTHYRNTLLCWFIHPYACVLAMRGFWFYFFEWCMNWLCTPLLTTIYSDKYMYTIIISLNQFVVGGKSN